jgi:hypothetical protein
LSVELFNDGIFVFVELLDLGNLLVFFEMIGELIKGGKEIGNI